MIPEKILEEARDKVVKKLMAITGTSILLGHEIAKFNNMAEQIISEAYPIIAKHILEDREKIADVIFPFRWFLSNNRDDALDLADQILKAYSQWQALRGDE